MEGELLSLGGVGAVGSAVSTKVTIDNKVESKVEYLVGLGIFFVPPIIFACVWVFKHFGNSYLMGPYQSLKLIIPFIFQYRFKCFGESFPS